MGFFNGGPFKPTLSEQDASRTGWLEWGGKNLWKEFSGIKEIVIPTEAQAPWRDLRFKKQKSRPHRTAFLLQLNVLLELVAHHRLFRLRFLGGFGCLRRGSNQ
jgi:hypothetical protein